MALSCSCNRHQTARIHVHIADSTLKEITVLVPLKGVNFWANRRVLPLNGDHNCVVEIPAADCGIVLIRTGHGFPRVITFPGDDIYMNVYNNRIGFEGDNAEGHEFFASLQRDLILDVQNPYRGDTSPGRIVDTIHAKRDRELVTLSQLHVKPAWRELAGMDIRYYYAASRADAMLRFKDAWGTTFEEMPLDTLPAIRTEHFRYYAGIYWNQYQQKDAVGQTAEYFRAQKLYYLLMQKTYESSLVREFDKFSSRWPDSRYIPYLKPAVDSIIAFRASLQDSFNPEFMNREVNSLAELLTRLKGEAYYIDIWSTWCAPCKEEFRYNAALWALTNSKNVRLLYLSIDKAVDLQKWKDQVKHYRLRGINLLANAQLQKDLYKEFGAGNTLPIPRYVVVNKEGHIVHPDAARPSDTAKLSIQLGGLE